MAYQVLARKWRPQRFDDVVGQQAVTRTLRNALASGRLAQSFIFAGPRGVGKTTTARILARAFNYELPAKDGRPAIAQPQRSLQIDEHGSFGAANNARLRAFLDSFGFEYEFQSATDWYKSGRFDKMLLTMLQHYDELQDVMLPTLGEERRATYSIFLPISPKSGRVLQVPIIQTKVDAGTIVYRDEDGTLVETPVTGGNVKLQWKADWAGRWFALGVDYEMYGKDLIPSAELSAKIVKILGGTPPDGFNYELFLDNEGKKISKSKGNGLSMEDWLRYGAPESLSYYMFQSPKSAKKLYFDVIPKATDEYLQHLESLALPAQTRGGAIHDARIAAICVSHGVAELWSADRDFSRFPQIVVRNPLIG